MILVSPDSIGEAASHNFNAAVKEASASYYTSKTITNWFEKTLLMFFGKYFLIHTIPRILYPTFYKTAF
jgi:hypothetical protein